jgi:predicted  nucleic acid-binding Zn-ribbon protein
MEEYVPDNPNSNNEVQKQLRELEEHKQEEINNLIVLRNRLDALEFQMKRFLEINTADVLLPDIDGLIDDIVILEEDMNEISNFIREQHRYLTELDLHKIVLHEVHDVMENETSINSKLRTIAQSMKTLDDSGEQLEYHLGKMESLMTFLTQPQPEQHSYDAKEIQDIVANFRTYNNKLPKTLFHIDSIENN